MNRLFFTAVAASLALSSTALAGGDLFIISGTGNGVAITPAGSDTLIGLVNDAVNNVGDFVGLANKNASLSLNYGGVANAITIDKNAANTFATLTFLNKDGTRTTRTFDTTAASANGQSLQQLIETYLKKGGSSDLKAFYEAMNAQSAVAVSDGNPNATTAHMADFIYNRFGRYNRMTSLVVPAPKPEGEGLEGDPLNVLQKGGPQLRFGVSGGAFSAGDFDGEQITVESFFDWNISKRIGLSVGSFAAFNGIGDADIYHLGIGIGVPFRPIMPSESCNWLWQITPSFTVGGSGSADMGSGGVVYSPAATSLLRWQVTPKFSLEMANQIGYFTGENLNFDGFSIDPGVEQTILKNGLEAELDFGNSGWYAYGGASYTNFLDDAAVSNYITPEAGVGWRTGVRGTTVEAGFIGSFGDNYSSYGGRVAVNFAF